MLVIGITGGIGSGKSTFCKELEKLGTAVYYADEEAKKLMVQDPQLMSDLKKAFGRETYHKDGSLNKEHLIREAFERDRVDKLNRLVHPAVGRDFERFCRRSKEKGAPLTAKEAALLLNHGKPEYLDRVVLILADKKNRLERVARRDGVSYSDVEARLRKQPEFEKLTGLADLVIYNDGSVEELKEKARLLFEEYTT